MNAPWLNTVPTAVGIAGADLTWFDEVVAPGAVSYGPDGRLAGQTGLVDKVTDLLYKLFYTTGEPVLWGRYTQQAGQAPAQSIAQVLHAANAGRGRRETDWRYVRQLAGGATVVEKHGLRLRVTDMDDIPTKAGTAVTVELPAGSFGRSQGFYVAHSEAPFPTEGPLTRLYLNVSCPFAGPLMHRVTSVLNEAGLPFDFKIANQAGGFFRCDTAVVYCRRPDFPALMELLYPDLLAAGRRGLLRDGTPALTCRIAPGVAAADDPGDGQSFGQHRCRIIAHGIVAALESTNGITPRQFVETAFRKAGVAIDRPYLTDPSTDPYADHFPH